MSLSEGCRCAIEICRALEGGDSRHLEHKRLPENLKAWYAAKARELGLTVPQVMEAALDLFKRQDDQGKIRWTV